MIYSRALRSLLSAVSLTPTPRPPALDSYFHPGTSIPTSILISRLNLLPAVSRSQPGSNLSFSSRLFHPLAFHSFSMHPSSMDRSVVFTGRFGLPLATARRIVSPRFSFFSFRFILFALFSVPMFRDFSFIPVDRLVHDNETVAQL